MSNKKKYVLFSPIGNHDPFGKKGPSVTEGPMLHIIRHYKPEVVILFLTKEMSDKENNDNRYTKNIKKLFPDCKIDIFNDGMSIVDAHKFDEFITPYSGIFNKIKEKYPDYEILFNVTSGTVQMISALILEAQISNINTKAIQVSTPERKSNGIDFYNDNDVECLKIELENTENRCEEPNFNAFKRMKLKFQVNSLISRYEYLAAINLVENEDSEIFIDKHEAQKSNKEELLNLLNHCRYRQNLEFEKAKKYYKLPIDDKLFEYFYTIRIKQEKQEFADFALKIPPILSELLVEFVDKDIPIDEISEEECRDGKSVKIITRDKIIKYDETYYTNILKFLDEKFKGKKGVGQFKDTFINTSTLMAIADYFAREKYNTSSKDDQKYKRLKNLFSSFTKFEQNIRNSLAHEITDINEDKIKEKSDYSSNKILQNLETILYLAKNFPKGRFVYDDLNKKIIELL